MILEIVTLVACHHYQQNELDTSGSVEFFTLVSALVSVHGMHVLQIAAAEAAARAEAQELEGWKRDSTAVLAALDGTIAEKITEVRVIQISSANGNPDSAA